MANQLNNFARSRIASVPRAANVSAAPLRSVGGAYTSRALPSVAVPRAPVSAPNNWIIPRAEVARAVGRPIANTNIKPVQGIAVARGVDVGIATGIEAVAGRTMLAAQAVAALNALAWDKLGSPYAQEPRAIRPGAIFNGSRFGLRVGYANSVVSVGNPGVPGVTQVQTFIGNFQDCYPAGIVNTWTRLYGATAASQIRGVPSPTLKQNLWDWNLPPAAQYAHVAHFPAPRPNPLAEPEPAVRAVNNPALRLNPRLSLGLSVSPGARVAVNTRPDFNDPLEYHDAKWRNKALMVLMHALEQAGDVGELLAVWYQAARSELFKQGIYAPAWSQASWETRLGMIARGFTQGVDYVSLAEGVGAWYIGERLGAILFPTSRTPGSGVSNNVRLHRPQNAMRDMFV